jgi:hypothetical protein
MMPVATVFGCSAATLIAVSLLTPAPSETTLRKFFPQPRSTALSTARVAVPGD